jgi:tRNA pseudouridine38-40 synthase
VNFRLTIEFDGSGYAGWQFQPGRPTVQGELEAAVGRVVGRETVVYGCGRTDAGVSARGYVANFHAQEQDRILCRFGSCPAAAERLRRAINHHLPRDIHVLSAEPVPESFHARHDALGKTYVYNVVRRLSPLRRGRAWELKRPVSAARARRSARFFLGTRDFRAFCHASDVNGECEVRRFDVTECGDELVFTIEGDRFLYKMVRRMVGAIVTYGQGGVSLRDLRAALAGRPHKPFRTAPAAGLVLDSVTYCPDSEIDDHEGRKVRAQGEKP